MVSEEGTASTTDGTLCAASAIPPNTWHHAVGVFEPSRRLALYLDGQLVIENTTDVVSQAFDVARSLRVGNDANSVFEGVLDEIRIYNRAVSASEVAGIFGGTQ